MSGWQKTGMRTLKSTDLELYLLAPWTLKCMFCFFKLTCKIVRTRQPAGATTLLCAVLWIWKNTSISSLIFCFKKKYHLKNAGIITHSFSIDFRYTVICFLIALSSGPCFFLDSEVLYKFSASNHTFCPTAVPATKLQELGAGSDNGEQ